MGKFNVVRIGRQAFHEVEADVKHIQCFCFLRFENSLVACDNGQSALKEFKKRIEAWQKLGRHKPELLASTGSVFCADQRMYRFSQNGRLWELTETDPASPARRNEAEALKKVRS